MCNPRMSTAAVRLRSGMISGVFLIAAIILAVQPSNAGTIVGVTGGLNMTKGMALSYHVGPCPCPDQFQWALYSTWTASSDFRDVSISAELDGVGTAYLTTRVGPGASASDLIASSPFAQNGLGPALLFSGLTLGPGSYYLVLTGPPFEVAPGPAWAVTYTPTVVTAPGVILGIDSSSDYLAFNVSFPPASPFHPDNLYGGYYGNYMFQVTGEPVPEPPFYILIGLGIAAVAVLRSRCS